MPRSHAEFEQVQDSLDRPVRLWEESVCDTRDQGVQIARQMFDELPSTGLGPLCKDGRTADSACSQSRAVSRMVNASVHFLRSLNGQFVHGRITKFAKGPITPRSKGDAFRHRRQFHGVGFRWIRQESELLFGAANISLRPALNELQQLLIFQSCDPCSFIRVCHNSGTTITVAVVVFLVPRMAPANTELISTATPPHR
jgi:hypothetical protein